MKTDKQHKRRSAVPTAAVRRVVVEFPAPLLNRAEGMLAELAINRSELIRRAVERYLEALEQAKLEQELAEGYVANAAQAKSLCEEFAYVGNDIV
jgi:metal-responsive CopG/Arc/MetJ family transcriptional regulator